MALQGPIPVEFSVVFPSGAYAAGAFEPVRNFDASTGEKFVQSNDKTSGIATDLSENPIRDIGLDAGLVDNKVCAVDEAWSGLRFVIRLKDRPRAKR